MVKTSECLAHKIQAILWLSHTWDRDEISVCLIRIQTPFEFQIKRHLTHPYLDERGGRTRFLAWEIN